jgi:REP element-mobilizing transposase RayT
MRLLRDVVQSYRWDCYAFCLMGTHYHVVIAADREALSAGLQRLNGVYAQLFNRRHGRTGHVFGDRFHAWVIADERHVRAACAYVVENPVRAGICATASEWPWSASRPAWANMCSSDGQG